MDCFAEPVIGRRLAPTRWLAMTKKCDHYTALKCGALSAISCGTGAAHGAPRRRLTSTSIQKVSQPRVGPMPSMVAGPWILLACAASRNMNGFAPPATFSISCRSRRRYCTMALSALPRCSRVRSWIAPIDSTALVVHVDVAAHAGEGRGRLLVRIEAVVV